NASQKLAQALGCRHIPFEALFSTRHDVLAVCGIEHGPTKEGGLQANYLKPSITVMDLTSLPKKSPLVQEAQRRGCDIVPPRRIHLRQTVPLLPATIHKHLTRRQLAQHFSDLLPAP